MLRAVEADGQAAAATYDPIAAGFAAVVEGLVSTPDGPGPGDGGPGDRRESDRPGTARRGLQDDDPADHPGVGPATARRGVIRTPRGGPGAGGRGPGPGPWAFSYPGDPGSGTMDEADTGTTGRVVQAVDHRMGWERRGEALVYYHPRRVGGRVVKDYFGSGPPAQLAADLVAEARDCAPPRPRRPGPSEPGSKRLTGRWTDWTPVAS